MDGEQPPENPAQMSFDLDQMIENAKQRCSDNLGTIEEKLNHLDKLAIISRLSVLTQTQVGKECFKSDSINETPCLQFVIGLSLKSDFSSEEEPTAQDIDDILRSLNLYFGSLHLWLC